MSLLEWTESRGTHKAETHLLGHVASVSYWVYTRKDGVVIAEMRSGPQVLDNMKNCETAEIGKAECEQHYIDILAKLPQIQGMLL